MRHAPGGILEGGHCPECGLVLLEILDGVMEKKMDFSVGEDKHVYIKCPKCKASLKSTVVWTGTELVNGPLWERSDKHE